MRVELKKVFHRNDGLGLATLDGPFHTYLYAIMTIDIAAD